MPIRIVSPSYPRQSGSERITNFLRLGIMGASASADSAAARMPGNPRHRLKVILVLAALFLVTLVSYSSNPSLHKEQLVHELSQLSDRAFKLPDHLRNKLLASELCSKQLAAGTENEQQEIISEDVQDTAAPIQAWVPPVPQPEYIEEIPLIPGFGGALSNPDNPTRNKCVQISAERTTFKSASDIISFHRFLVPIFACDEQETGAQMHVRCLQPIYRWPSSN